MGGGTGFHTSFPRRLQITQIIAFLVAHVVPLRGPRLGEPLPVQMIWESKHACTRYFVASQEGEKKNLNRSMLLLDLSLPFLLLDLSRAKVRSHNRSHGLM